MLIVRLLSNRQRVSLLFLLASGLAPGLAVATLRQPQQQTARKRATRSFLAQEQGATMQLTALFILLVGLPLSIVAGDLTRYVYVRSVLQRSADAAAEAAAQQADIWHFQNTGDVRFNRAAPVEAARVAYANSSPLLAQGVYPSIDYIGIDQVANLTTVHMSARLRLFTIGAPDVRVAIRGTAALRMRQE
jgi:hypothetical protein